MVCKMLAWLCDTQPSARTAALRALVEAVLDSTPSALFGRVAAKNTSTNPPLISLMKENLKQVCCIYFLSVSLMALRFWSNKLLHIFLQ